MDQNNRVFNNQADTTSSSAQKIQDVQRQAELDKTARAQAGRAVVGQGSSSLNKKDGLGKPNVGGTNASSGVGTSTSSSLGSQASRNNALNRANNLRNNNYRNGLNNGIHQLKRYTAREGIKAAGQSVGIPTGLTEKALNTRPGEQLVDKVVAGSDPLRGVKNLVKGLKPDSEKTLDEKSDEREEQKRQSGEISGELSLKTIKRLSLVAPVIAVIMIFMVGLVAAMTDSKVSELVLGELTTKEKATLIKEMINETADDLGDLDLDTSELTGMGTELAYGKGNDDFPQEYYDRLASLGNNYSLQSTCKGEECFARSEFMYYLKVADLSLRYENKYHVKLDWPLIIAANLSFNEDTEDMMEANLSNYDKDNVENYDTLSELDWDNDFQNIAGYKYLDGSDSRYDLNILAKNMVKKKTTQTCTDSSGNVVKTQTDEDVEDKYFAEGGSKRLTCASGQNYIINSVYTKDLEKFDAFLLEYIDRKLESSDKGSNSIIGNDMSETFVNLALAQLDDPEAVNGKKYWTWFGFSYRFEWCAAFVSWVAANTEFNGQSLSEVLDFKSTSVFGWVNYFYENPNLKFVFNDNCSRHTGKNGEGTYTPKEGDFIFFDWDSDWNGKVPTYWGPLDHVGIVQRVEDGKIITIEGNSSNKVAERTYNIDSCSVAAFGSWY